jgi:hypothetical protein
MRTVLGVVALIASCVLVPFPATLLVLSLLG